MLVRYYAWNARWTEKMTGVKPAIRVEDGKIVLRFPQIVNPGKFIVYLLVWWLIDMFSTELVTEIQKGNKDA